MSENTYEIYLLIRSADDVSHDFTDPAQSFNNLVVSMLATSISKECFDSKAESNTVLTTKLKKVKAKIDYRNVKSKTTRFLKIFKIV